MADKKISELDLALLINNDAVFPMSQDNAGEPTTFKVGITQLGTEIAEDMTFSNLRTTSKKLIGAINEVLSLGSPIIIGTTAPTSSIGADKNLYIQYTEGTGGADDEVDGIYVKIDGAWCEIQTGGGSGTTDYDDLSNKPQVNSIELVGNMSLDDLGIMPASLSKTASGSIASFTDGAENIPVKSLVSQIVATGGGGTPDAPISISGFNSGVITRCGKNLLVNRRTTTTLNGVTFTVNSDGSITLSGTASTSFQYNLNNSPLKSAKYTMSNGNTNLISGIALFAVTPSGNKDVNRITGFVTFEDSVSLVALWITSGTNTSGITIKPMIELGDTATDFEAYNGNTYTFTFGQTVYGGHFDNKGNLVVTHGYIASYNGETINEPWISSMDEYVPNTSPSTGAQVVYPLTTPITLSITSQDIPTLLGENNIFSNCGDVEVDYYTDNADEIAEVAKATASTPLHNYSTAEQVVGTWVDGSTVYEKTVISTSELSKDTMNQIALGITDIDVCVSVSGFASYGSNNTYIPLPYGDKGNSLICLMNINKALSVANVWVGSDYTSPSTVNIVIITIRYTKSST